MAINDIKKIDAYSNQHWVSEGKIKWGVSGTPKNSDHFDFSDASMEPSDDDTGYVVMCSYEETDDNGSYAMVNLLSPEITKHPDGNGWSKSDDTYICEHTSDNDIRVDDCPFTMKK